MGNVSFIDGHIDEDKDKNCNSSYEDRERLIELLKEAENLPICSTFYGMADHLISNGVTFKRQEME